MSRAALRRLVELAGRRYRPAGRHAYHFARGKLGADPLFAALLARSLIPSGARILDLGCGQALVAAWLEAARILQSEGGWPEGWPPAPRLRAYRGIELMARDVERARKALGGEPSLRVEQGDIRSADLGSPEVVLAFDVLHYIDGPAQLALIARIRAALGGGGVLLMRVGDREGGLRQRFSDGVDRLVCRLRGLEVASLSARPLRQWLAILDAAGFATEALPMSAGTTFANTLLVARPREPGDAMRVKIAQPQPASPA